MKQGLGSSLARPGSRFDFAFLLCTLWAGLVPSSVRAEALSVYITAKAADPELNLEALEVSALARAALLDAQGFDWQTADIRVRGPLTDARAAQKRALVALRRGRQAYLRLELDVAIAALSGALPEWSNAQPVIDSPEPEAETLMYLGASYVLADDRLRAAQVFTRYHLQFAAVTPNSGLFNPAIMEQWEEAGAALRRRAAGAIDVRARPASAVVTVDGMPRGTGSLRVAELWPGRHWLRVAGVGAEGRMQEVTVESGRVSVADMGELPDSAVLLDLFEHASSPKGARALAEALSVRALGVIEVRRTEKPGELELELRSFEGESGREQAQLTRVIGGGFVERSHAVRGLVAAWLDRVLNAEPRRGQKPARPAQAGAPWVTEESLDPASTERREDQVKPQWYRRWWVWALAGGVVAAGAVTTVLLVQNRDQGPSTPQSSDKGTLILEF